MTRPHKGHRLYVLVLFLLTGGLSGALVTPTALAGPLSKTYTLSTGNSGVSGYTGPFGTVTVSLSGTNVNAATITFYSDIANGVYFFGNPSVAINSSGPATISQISGNALEAGLCSGSQYACYSINGTKSMDGFGNFSNSVTTTDGFTHRSSEISFALTLVTGTWANATSVFTGNNMGHLIAAHIGICNSGCSGFATTGFASGTSAIGTPIPGPSSLVILGSGLLALGWVGSRRSRYDNT